MERQEEKKKARVSDPKEEVEGEKSSIYFLVRELHTDDSARSAHWYVADLSNSAKRKGVGGFDVGGTAGSAVVKMGMEYPIGDVDRVAFGSFGTLIYGLGGLLFDSRAMLFCWKYFRSVFFYNTANPAKGWFAGPDMIATRWAPLHRVVDGKLYVLGGISLSTEEIDSQPRYPWGEYLDLSPLLSPHQRVGQWQWHPLDFPLSPLSSEEDPPSALDLDVMKGNFDPDRHLLVRIGRLPRILVCYDVHRKLFRRFPASDVLGFFQDKTLVVDGDYVFAPNATEVAVVGLSGKRGSSPPWFNGSVEGMCGTCDRLPPLPPHCLLYDDDDYEEPMFPPDPAAFSLLRIAPFKYATLWSTRRKVGENEKPTAVRLSVFTVSPASPPIMEGDTPLLRARFDVSDEHLELGLQLDVEVLAAVAV